MTCTQASLATFALKVDNRLFIIRQTFLARILWIRLNSVGSILDVASGDGRVYSTDIPLLTTKYIWFRRMENVTSLDKGNVPKIYRNKGYPEIETFIQADAEHLPFRDNSFDTVTLSEILEHPIDPEQVLAEAKRVGRKRILITVPDEDSWIKKRVWRHFSIIDSWEHVRLFNADKLRKYFEEAGLNFFEINHVLFGGFEYYVAKINLEAA